MKYLLSFLIGFMCGLAAPMAYAETLEWLPPIEREDGTLLLPTEIAGYNIYNDQNIRINQAIIEGTTYDVDRIKTGPQILYVRTMDTDGLESKNSLVSVTIPQLILAPPNPPSGFGILGPGGG